MNINRETIRLYWQQVRKFKVSFFLMMTFIPISSFVIDTMLPYFLSQAIGGLAEGDWAVVKAMLWVAGGMVVLGGLLNFVGFQAIVRHESNVRTSLLNATFASLLNKDMRFFVNEKVGALTSRFIDFLRAQVSLQDLLAIRTLGFILSVGVGMFIIAMQSWILFGVVLVLVVALLFQVRWSLKKRAPWRHERKRIVGEVHGIVADAVTNNVVVKTFAREEKEREAVLRKGIEFQTAFKKDIGFLAAEGSARLFVMSWFQIVAISIAAWLVFDGVMNIATAVFVLAYLQRIASQIFTLGDILNGYDQALLEASPMTEMLKKENVVLDREGAKDLELEEAGIEFVDVDYRYSDGNEDVLNGVNLKIPSGQKVGLVGHSGAGKTTITHLLLRFVDVTGGRLLIGGKDVRDVTQKSLRENIAYVPQEPMLFHRSLRENIAYGRVEATYEEIVRAAKMANAMEFIEKLPQGLDTVVGERGVKLSGGQRQRIAIARAILKDAPILVLDEATSALDSESEKLIQEALEKLMKGRTAIVIAHRLSTIAKLDRLVVIDSGQVVEDGTHSELLERGGIYARLWAHQSGGFVG